MRTIYRDNEFRCHTINDGTMTAIETDLFDGKCDDYIEGYRLLLHGEMWISPDGFSFFGEMCVPCKPYGELVYAQRDYELQLLAEYESVINELYSEVTT